MQLPVSVVGLFPVGCQQRGLNCEWLWLLTPLFQLDPSGSWIMLDTPPMRRVI